MIPWLIALLLLAEDPKIFLGVLEEIPGHFEGQAASRGVRVVFEKNGRAWKPFPNSCADEACLKAIASQYPPAVTWTIAFSGRNFGQVTGATPKTFEFYSDIGVQAVTSKGAVPAAGKRAAEFGGFLGTPLLRPLIADSQPYYKDPDGWKPARPSAEEVAGLRAQFRRKFPKVSNCASGDYRDTDIEVRKAYSSIHRWSVVEILLKGNRCDGPPDDAFEDQWFAVSPRGEAKFIGHGMWMVDAGDYDNDGKSEIVFAIDRYNEGGYELFYDDFKGHAVFRFSYH